MAEKVKGPLPILSCKECEYFHESNSTLGICEHPSFPSGPRPVNEIPIIYKKQTPDWCPYVIQKRKEEYE
jgi:hypothetical protein